MKRSGLLLLALGLAAGIAAGAAVMWLLGDAWYWPGVVLAVVGIAAVVGLIANSRPGE